MFYLKSGEINASHLETRNKKLYLLRNSKLEKLDAMPLLERELSKRQAGWLTD
jgi:hypothetical protein